MKAILAWGAATVAAGGLWGAAWLTQTVTVPLWGLFILTWIPTRELTQVAQSGLERIETRLQQNT